MSFVVFLFIFASVFLLLFPILDRYFISLYSNRLVSGAAYYKASLPARLALAVLPKSRIFRSVALPIPGREGEEIQLGTVIVSRSGIFVLCQINGKGILENPPSENWKHISSGKFTEFTNPFVNQKDARALIDYYLDLEGHPEIKAHSVVLYTDRDLRFTHQKSRGIIFAGDFCKKLRDFEKRGRLSSQQVRLACSVLRDIDAY